MFIIIIIRVSFSKSQDKDLTQKFTNVNNFSNIVSQKKITKDMEERMSPPPNADFQHMSS